MWILHRVSISAKITFFFFLNQDIDEAQRWQVKQAVAGLLVSTECSLAFHPFRIHILSRAAMCPGKKLYFFVPHPDETTWLNASQ